MAIQKVYPGINPRARIDLFSKREQEIVNHLSKEFYITTGCKTLNIGQSVYRYFFIKFPDDKATSFGAKDELIALFSPFANFEPRTLDAIEKIQSENNGFRLDKICAFVFSDDSGFIEKLDKTIKSQKESRLIIPFCYHEITPEKDSKFYRSRIKSYFFERNLYDFDNPLRTDIYFFGRDELCQGLIDKHLSNQSASLFGLRRSGKTSILLSVCRRLAHQHRYASLIDCQTLHLLSWNLALYKVIETINNDNHTKIPIEISKYNQENAVIQFEHDLSKISGKLKKPMLLAFDEIEQIAPVTSITLEWRTGEYFIKFWHVLRAAFQKQNNAFTVLIAGTNPKCLEVPFIQGADNPLFKQIKAEYIPGFSVPQTKQMIETLSSYMGISVDEDVYTYLTREFGGHPFLIRQACSHIKSIIDKDHDRRIDRKLYESSVESFNNGSGRGYCEMVVGVLREHYPDEYAMLSYLARGDAKDFIDLAASDPNYTEHLLGYGVLVKSSSGYDFNIDAIRTYLSQRDKYKKLQLNNAEKLAEIGARRNEAEQKLRKMVSQILKTTLGEVSAKAAILAKHEFKKRAKYTNLDYRDLFNANKHEIYFDDLRELMRKNWETSFRNHFDEDVEKFNSRMIILNSIGRSDAHSKKVSDADFQSFRGAMEWLEQHIFGYFE